ncbi:AraC family transcriptional regulator [Maribacter algicola]|uniref:AraC family transcriptional regulator n=1 Tax=Maribacter algicola TaxID=2498892 RepID=A0A3R8PWQ7_9FLAO|nr:AraC family transcriptional regulator [Maribacter algicola]RRQ48137.1 AraC family transcriptional regulator [Maribacter algicola]
MKLALEKSPIPKTHALLTKRLKQPLFDPNWHFHPEYQLFMVVKGRGTQFIGDSIRPYKEGEITFTGPNLPHLWRSDVESQKNRQDAYSEGIVVYFNGNAIGENLLQKEEGLKLKQLLEKSVRGILIKGKTAQEVQRGMQNLVKLEGLESVLGLLRILNLMSETKEIEFLASPGYINSLKQGDTERMNTVYAYVMKNFRNKISLDELAQLTNMTPTSFSRYFKVHANKTFSEFVSEIRIGHACKLLLEEKMNASQACYSSGFQTLSNFNKQFKSITRRTPSAYKKEFAPH